MAGILKRFAGAGADLLEEFYSKTPKQRLEDASERATYDPEDGGLGLAPGNTSYERMQLMFPTQVYHGGAGTAASKEQPPSRMFLSPHPTVAGTYAKGPPRNPVPEDSAHLRKNLIAPPDFAGNVMPIRLDASDAAVMDFENRFFSGQPSDLSPDSVLNDVMVRDSQGTDMLRFRYELDDRGFPVRRGYLPNEQVGEIAKHTGFTTDMLHGISGTSMTDQYGMTPPVTQFDNVIDIGYGFRYRGEPKSMNDPNNVYVVRDGSKVRSEFGAFDPLLRKYSGLSLGASAAAVGSLLDQLPPGKSSEGALYER